MEQLTKKIIEEIKKECRGIFKRYEKKINEPHRWDHVERVRETALRIAKLYNENKEQKVNLNELEITALLHDIGRYKDEKGNHAEWSYKLAKQILEKYENKLKLLDINTERILKIIRNHSFSKKEECFDEEIFEDIEYKILTDADKIDSFGPIGILRASLDERFNTIKKQLEHIKKKVDPNNYEIRTIEGRIIGGRYKEYLASFLKDYKEQAKTKIEKIMLNKTEKDLWVEMSIREIWTQAHFAEIAYSQIDPKAANANDAVFSSIHSFLSHCAMISKMLKATDDSVLPKSIGNVLGIPDVSVIHQRTFRNHLEHYDDRLKRWIKECGVGANIGTYNIGPRSAIQIPNMVFVSHYDPDNQKFTFLNEDFDLAAIFKEVKRIEIIADSWVKKLESRKINPPFI